jgi:hypothetical protein
MRVWHRLAAGLRQACEGLAASGFKADEKHDEKHDESLDGLATLQHIDQ